MSDITVTATSGGTINVSTGTVVGPLPQLQVAAGNGITISSSGGVSTISANVAQLAIPSNLADLANVQGAPSAGQVLAWNGTAWSPADDKTGGSSDVSNLSDLADVSQSAPSAGQALLWSGSDWAAGNVPATTQINGLSGNVTLSAGANLSITTSGQKVIISSSATQASAGSISSSPGDGLRLDDSLRLELADDPPRDVSLVGFGDNGLRAVFARQATADTDRGSATYEVEFLPVTAIPSVLLAEQVGDANRTLSVQGLVQAGQRWSELSVSSDNGTSWSSQRIALDDDSGVWLFSGAPPGSLRAGQRLLRVRGADTANNLTAASYSSNFSANYDVAGYHAPAILQSQCSGSGVSVVGVLADEDLSRSELNLSAASVRVGWLPDGGSATYATASAETSEWLPYFAYTEQYNENSTVFSSSLAVSPEGWGSLIARVDGDEGAGDPATVSGNFYNFAGNYTLPKAAQQEPTVFLVAKTATATNLPAGVTAGTFGGAIATRRNSPSSSFVLYQPDSAQEFQFQDGNISVITLSAEIAASSTGSVLLIAESDGMYPLNEDNANWSYTTEPSMSMLVADSNGATVASQAVSPTAGEATEIAVSANLDEGSVYYVTLSVSHSSGSRALVPQVRLRTDEGAST